jgi:hypothetical protein
LKNLERIVRPIPDADYTDYVDQYHIVLDDDDGCSEHDDDGDGGPDEDSKVADDGAHEDDDDDEDDDDEEIDEEELLDLDTWNSARDLREKIRTISGNVQAIRERILQQAEERVTVTSLAQHLQDNRVQVTGDDDQCNPGDGSGGPNIVSLNKEAVDNHGTVEDGVTRDETNPLCNSLQALSKVLQDPQWELLPQRIRSLQDTIGAIQSETAENRVLSGVEMAIQSRTNHMHDTAILEASRKLFEDGFTSTSQDDGGSSDSFHSTHTLSAVDRLALFGQFFS